MKRIKEVVVVEGRDDTTRLKQWFDVDTLETNGSALTDEMLEQMARLAKTRGVIVLTDPDFSGEQIRKKITEKVPEAKHAFITKKEARPKHQGSLGVEHASYEALKSALEDVMTPANEEISAIPEAWLWQAGLLAGNGAKWRRKRLGEKLHIGYTNGKQLKKRLAMFHITKEQFCQAMEEIGEETNGK